MKAASFRGLDVLLTTLQSLLHRPRAFRADTKPLTSERTRHWHSWEVALPIICLVGGPAADWVRALTSQLNQAAPPKVLYAALDVDKAVREVLEADERGSGTGDSALEPRLLPLLTALRRQLAIDRFGRDRVRGFRISRLVDWLLRQPARSNHTWDERATITTLLRSWHHARPAQSTENSEPVRITTPGGLQFTPGAVLRRIRYQWWIRFGRERSWLMHQPFLTPGHSESFTGFAALLLGAGRREEVVEEVKVLLMHAFLQDLRREYGTATWRLRRGRRTSHALALLTGVREDNGGWELARLINEVRNRSTEPDPLLVVATSGETPPWLTGDDHVDPVYRLPGALAQVVRAPPRTAPVPPPRRPLPRGPDAGRGRRTSGRPR